MLIGTHKKQNVWAQLMKGYEDKIIDEEAFKTGLRTYKFSKGMYSIITKSYFQILLNI